MLQSWKSTGWVGQARGRKEQREESLEMATQREGAKRDSDEEEEEEGDDTCSRETFARHNGVSQSRMCTVGCEVG